MVRYKSLILPLIKLQMLQMHQMASPTLDMDLCMKIKSNDV